MADWYAGWTGERGSQHHQQLAIPALLELLALQPGERVLDVGCGHGVLAPYVREAGASYVGLDVSPRLLKHARRLHGAEGTFLLGDARRLPQVEGLPAARFDAVAFLLSIQDMDPLAPVLAGAAKVLAPAGRLALVLGHPCFRVPRQSGWGWDEGRKLRYRRVDRYLTPLPVPMKDYAGGAGKTITFHRPLQDYVNGLAVQGLWVDRLIEIPTFQAAHAAEHARAENLANREIPLFLALRARRPEGATT